MRRRVLSTFLTAVALIAIVSSNSFAEDKCTANISPKKFGGTKHITVVWTVTVQGCKKTSGTYDFTMVLTEEDPDKERRWERTRGWDKRESAKAFEVTDTFTVGATETLSDVEEAKVTTCTCEPSEASNSKRK